MFNRAQDTDSAKRLFGCERFHPPHDHWHLLDFSRYKLVRQRTGRTVVRSTKIGFCVIDTDRRFASLPGSPAAPYYPAGSADCDRDSIDGLSVGWTDTYAYSLPGQQLNVTGLRRGRYCLVSKADPSQPAAGVRQLEQRPPGPDRAAPGEAEVTATRPLR